MAIAALKLESFSSAPMEIAPQIGPKFTQDDLDRARDEGLEEGQKLSAQSDIENLRAELDRMAELIELSEARHREIHAEAVATLLPVLSEIIEAMSPSVVSQRLEQALKQELDRMANSPEAVSVKITCGEKLKEMVEQCVADSQLAQFKLECTAGDDITLSHSGTSLRLCQERITKQIQNLIEEIKEDSTTWMM